MTAQYLINKYPLLSLIIAIFFCFVISFYFDDINRFIISQVLQYDYLIKRVIAAVYIGVFLFGYCIKKLNNDKVIFINSIQNFFTALAPVLGGYQLAIWLLLDNYNVGQVKFLPNADGIDFSVFVIAVILLLKLSFEQLLEEWSSINSIREMTSAIKVSPAININDKTKNPQRKKA